VLAIPPDDRRLPFQVAKERLQLARAPAAGRLSFSQLRAGTIDVLAFPAEEQHGGLPRATVALAAVTGLRLSCLGTRSERPGACNSLQAPFVGI
jgi:hypothetical protein